MWIKAEGKTGIIKHECHTIEKLKRQPNNRTTEQPTGWRRTKQDTEGPASVLLSASTLHHPTGSDETSFSLLPAAAPRRPSPAGSLFPPQPQQRTHPSPRWTCRRLKACQRHTQNYKEAAPALHNHRGGLTGGKEVERGEKGACFVQSSPKHVSELPLSFLGGNL